MPDLPYQKIVSLVPSLTELLFDLGLNDQVIGRTRFCIHPEEEIEETEIVGGTKNPRLEKIIKMRPDLIIANKEENRKEDIEILRKYSKIHLTEIDSIEGAMLAITSIGSLLGVENEAQNIIDELNQKLSQKPELPELSAAYFIWKDPWMTIGNDTYIHNVLKTYNLRNVYQDQTRYPKTSLKALGSLNPDIILLSSEPYPFKEKHKEEIREVCPASKVELVNGEWFSWYGSRMIEAFTALNSWRKSLS